MVRHLGARGVVQPRDEQRQVEVLGDRERQRRLPVGRRGGHRLRGGGGGGGGLRGGGLRGLGRRCRLVERGAAAADVAERGEGELGEVVGHVVVGHVVGGVVLRRRAQLGEQPEERRDELLGVGQRHAAPELHVGLQHLERHDAVRERRLARRGRAAARRAERPLQPAREGSGVERQRVHGGLQRGGGALRGGGHRGEWRDGALGRGGHGRRAHGGSLL